MKKYFIELDNTSSYTPNKGIWKVIKAKDLYEALRKAEVKYPKSKITNIHSDNR